MSNLIVLLLVGSVLVALLFGWLSLSWPFDLALGLGGGAMGLFSGLVGGLFGMVMGVLGAVFGTVLAAIAALLAGPVVLLLTLFGLLIAAIAIVFGVALVLLPVLIPIGLIVGLIWLLARRPAASRPALPALTGPGSGWVQQGDGAPTR